MTEGELRAESFPEVPRTPTYAAAHNVEWHREPYVVLNGVLWHTEGITTKPRTINPFKFGPLALDQAFTDRAPEVRELRADIRNGQDVVVFAPRRYGKSSLVWRVAQTLVEDKVLVAQVDLMRTPSKERLAEKLAKTIHEQISTPLIRTADRLKLFGQLRIKPTMTVSDDGEVSFGFDARAADRDIDATLEELLRVPGELAAQRNRRVALILDEFQQVVDIDSDLLKLMRSVFQEQPEVAHVFLGSKRHMMERIFNNVNEPFWRSAKKIELGVIQPELFETYAGERFAATGKTLHAGARAATLEITGGHPYATQQLLYFLWEETPAGRTADVAALERALAATLRSEHTHFSLVWDNAAAAQRLVLQALATDQPGRPLSAEYQRRHNLPPSNTVQSALNALIRDELVAKPAPGEYLIVEPFLAEWITLVESAPAA